MFCDVFNRAQANELLKNKQIWFIGSSNMRAIYKDVLWLTQHDCLATKLALKFITRNYQDHFIDLIKSVNQETAPDVIFLNSCLWDLTRWGPDGPAQFRDNIMRVMKFLKSELPAKTRVIWKTTLPVSTSANGTILVNEIRFIVPMLPWHILEANVFASTCASFFDYDVLDFHHYMRLQGHMRVKDGIHWNPIAHRYLTNAFLTHLCLSWGKELPGKFKPSCRYLNETTRISIQENKIKDRVEKKEGFFKKLFAKMEKDEKNKKGRLSGIKNKILTASKQIFKRKKKNKKKLKQVNNAVVDSRATVYDNAASGSDFNQNYGYYYMQYASPMHGFGASSQTLAIQQESDLESDSNYYKLNYHFPSQGM